MSTIQVTVGIDRLRFEPEAEFQTKTVDLLCQTAEAIWQFLSIEPPSPKCMSRAAIYPDAQK